MRRCMKRGCRAAVATDWAVTAVAGLGREAAASVGAEMVLERVVVASVGAATAMESLERVVVTLAQATMVMESLERVEVALVRETTAMESLERVVVALVPATTVAVTVVVVMAEAARGGLLEGSVVTVGAVMVVTEVTALVKREAADKRAVERLEVACQAAVVTAAAAVGPEEVAVRGAIEAVPKVARKEGVSVVTTGVTAKATLVDGGSGRGEQPVIASSS